jgi:peptidoglycan/LPS O-acetylase OafA/YrhL
MTLQAEIPAIKSDYLEYKPALDILRFLAAFWVILSHAGAVRGGGHAVTIFFVLSGYLIGGQLLDEKLSNNYINFKSFYFKRITRIWPPYFIALFFYLLIFFLRGENRVEGFYGRMVGATTYTYNLMNEIHGNINPAWISFNQIWSLSIEEQFYLIAPIFLSWAPIAWILPLNLFFFLFFYLTFPDYSGLFCGIIVAHLLRNLSSQIQSNTRVASSISLFLFIILAWQGQAKDVNLLLILVLSSFLIASSTFINIEKKYHHTIRYIGLMTYSSYLLHGVPVYFLSPIYRKMYSVATTPVWFNVFCGILSLGISYQFVKRIDLLILEKRKNLLKNRSPIVQYAPLIAWGLGVAGLFSLLAVLM